MGRVRGILSEADREYLLADEEDRVESYSQPARSKRRSAIRERVRNGILDFTLLYDHLEESELEKIFSIDEGEELAFRDALESIIALLYLGCEQEYGSDVDGEQRLLPPFRTILDVGISSGEARRHPTDVDPLSHVDVSFSVEVQTPLVIDQDRVVDKIAQYKMHELSEAEARFALSCQHQESSQFDLAATVEQRREELDIQAPKFLGVVENQDDLDALREAHEQDVDEG